MNPDDIIVASLPVKLFGRAFAFDVSMTLAGTWIVMAFIFVFFRHVTRNFSPDFRMTRMQGALEAVVIFFRDQVESMTGRRAGGVLYLVMSLFVFILVANWSALLPIPFPVEGGTRWYAPPTASLSTAAALAIVVMCSVVFYGVRGKSLGGYLGKFFEPVFVLLPINVLGDLSNGMSLAVRLYGNVMSAQMLVGMLFAFAPFVLPGLMGIFGLVSGTIQPYIFATLAAVYISAGLGEATDSEREELERLRLQRV
ncbi:MAG: F0F1 ATP synthase subunit A [Rickettsiales bacterium]|jgi:F-type H+-transporting ATPase subunit a|nr:F0F1 ATP synthase subunit A [Rickettsiales bacterium]